MIKGKQEITKALEGINFLERYRLLCSKFNNFNSSRHGKKQEIVEILDSINRKYRYHSNDRAFEIFYQQINNDFLLTFRAKDGLIECFLKVISRDFVIINNRLDAIGEAIQKGFRETLEINIPISTTLDDLRIIIETLIKIFDDFYFEIIK